MRFERRFRQLLVHDRHSPLLRFSVCRYHGPTRSPSVLAALLRMRQQYQRAHNVTSAGGSSASSSHGGYKPLACRDVPVLMTLSGAPVDPAAALAQERHQLSLQASKLLRKEMRGAESLSDVDTASPAFGVEVGKLLSVAAAFGAETTAPRVADALDWVRAHKQHLTSARQVMSIAMPLLSLRDGRAAGRLFLTAELFAPLDAALRAPLAADQRSQRGAVVSVFGLAAKLLEPDDAAEGAVGVGTIAALLANATDAILRTAKAPTPPPPPLDVSDCAQLVQACQRLEAAGAAAEAHEILARLEPVLSVALGPSAQISVTGQGSMRRAADVCHVLSSASRLQQRRVAERIARPALALLPPALAAATAKDLCLAAQVMVRLRQVAPAVADAAALEQFMVAVRPKLFLIAETHAAQLRHVECSVLLSNLSRLDVPMEADLVNLLCTRFLAHMEVVQPGHLIPLLQGLVRCADFDTRRGDESRCRSNSNVANTLEVVVPLWEKSTRLPAILPCLEKAADRVIAWASVSELTGAEAAQILLCLSQLQFPRTLTLYEALEPMIGAAAFSSTSNDNDAVPLGDNVALLVSFLHSLDAFCTKAVTTTKTEEKTIERAEELRVALRKCAVRHAAEAQTPKDLVMLLQLLGESRHDDTKLNTRGSKNVEMVTTTEDAVERDLQEDKKEDGDIINEDERDQQRQQQQPQEQRPKQNESHYVKGEHGAQLDKVVRRVVELAALSNAYEVGALARLIADLSRGGGRIDAATSAAATAALAQRGALVELTANDLQSLLDAMRRAGLRLKLPPPLLRRATALLRTTPWRTSLIVRRMLPILRQCQASQSQSPSEREEARDALMEFTETAMTNTQEMMNNTDGNHPPSLHETALLAYGLAQLHILTISKHTHNHTVTHINEDEDVFEERRGNEVGEKTGNEEDEDHVNPINDDHHAAQDGNVDGITNMVESHVGSRGATHMITAFMAIGDAVCLALQRLHEGDNLSLVSSDEKINKKHDYTHLSGTPLRAKELVMLIQSFERVGVRHPALLYELLPFTRDMSATMEPLEISLLLNAFARLGVWNGRVLNTLSRNVAARVPTCSLRHCQAILQALQSSHFLRPGAFVWTSETREDAQGDWYKVGKVTEDPLISLATCVVERMTTLVDSPAAISALLQSHSLHDTAAAAKVLGYFDHPPQPAFDTYVALAIARLTSEVDVVERDAPTVRRRLGTAVALAPLVCRVRRYDHQCKAATAIAGAMQKVVTATLTSSEGVHLYSPEQVAAVYHWRCVFAALHSVPFTSSDAAPLLNCVETVLRCNDEDLTLHAQHDGEDEMNPFRLGRVLRLLTRFASPHFGDSGTAHHLAYNVVAHTVARYASHAEAAPIPPLAAASLLDAALADAPSSLEGPMDTLLASLLRMDAPLPPTAAATAVLAAAHRPTDAPRRTIDTSSLMTSPLGVRPAVTLLLAASHTNKGTDPNAVSSAARALVARMGRTDRGGQYLLPELYRLATASGARFPQWCVGLERGADDGVLEVYDRLPSALLRARRAARRGEVPTLCATCRTDVAMVYEKYRRSDAAGMDEVLKELAAE